MRLRPAKTKTIFLLTISLCFTAIGLFSGKGILGWCIALFFGVCAVAFTIHLWPGASYLQLSPDSFVVCTLFRRWPPIRWDRVSEFEVALIPGSGIRKVVFSRDPSPHPRLAAISRSLVGATDTLPDNYGRSPEQLAELMNEWKRRAG